MTYQPEAFDAKKLSQLKTRASEIEGQLTSSNTAMAAGTDPTVQDLANQASLSGLNRNIEVMKGKEIAEKWYGPRRDEETFKGEGSQESPLMKGLNALSVPLYATAGAVEGALGKGSKKGIMDNITANVKEREGFGNILRRTGLPYAASMPIGFALDVALDPINWATAGTAALIPRMAVGLAKGGGKGLATGAASRLIPLGTKTANVLSFGGITRAQNTAARFARSGEVPKGFNKFSSTVGNVSKNITKVGSEAADQYDNAIGREVLTSKSGVRYGKDIVREGGSGYMVNGERYSMGDTVQKFIADLPGGQTLIKNFKYSPANWLRLKRIESEVIRNEDKFKETTGMDFIPKTQASSAGLKELGDEGTEKMIAEKLKTPEGAPVMGIDNVFSEGADDASSGMSEVRRSFNDGAALAEGKIDPSAELSSGSAEIMRNLVGESMNDVSVEDIQHIFDKFKQSKSLTGVKWYDEGVEKLRGFKINDTPVVAKLMDAYSAYISMFKLAKIGLTPAAHMNAILGNTTMIKMGGINVENPEMINTLYNILKIITKKGPAGERLLVELFNDPVWIEYAKKDSLGFSGTFNFSLDEIFERAKTGESLLEGALRTAKANKKLPGSISDDITADKRLMESISNQLTDAVPAKPGHVEYTSYVRNEIDDASNPFTRFTKYIQGKVSAENKRVSEKFRKERLGEQLTPADLTPIAGRGTKLADLALNKLMEAFGGIDQIFRIGTAIHISKNGISEAEMNIVARTFGVTKDDILDVVIDAVSGEKRFKITPAKATEISGEIFLNYSAMPAAVKVMRTLPVLGAPFASFLYGMTTRTGKTALYNPALFSKTNYLLQELSGDKSPLEKEAMKSKYYSWFNDPGMVKLPFVDKYPLYANVTNMIPYYSMNMFTPSERKYGETLPDSVMSFLDKFPVLQDPAGQVLFDYMIQPMLLSKQQQPQGSFGQALYPIGATGVEKVGYAARQLAEGVTPGIAGFAALATAPFTTTGEHVEYVPSYRYRQLANALKGKTTLGIPSKESPASRSLRTAGSMIGVPTHPMDLSYTEQQTKKNIKKNQ